MLSFGFMIICVLLLKSTLVSAHGRLIEPPSRASAWRYGFKTPIDYNDNQLFCGGSNVQHNSNGGKCGVCGDNFKDKVKLFEYPGKYATGTIVRSYTQGDIMDVTVDLTTNHQGYFEFQICANNNVKKTVEDSCFKKLSSNNDSQRFMITTEMGSKKFHYKLKLPDDLVCSQCVVRWHYNTGNSWGCENEKCALGLGPQETFRGCADIKIKQSNGAGSDQDKTDEVPSTSSTKAADITTAATPSTKTTTSSTTTTEATNDGNKKCEVVGVYKPVPGMQQWCINNCFHDPPFCPASHCICT